LQGGEVLEGEVFAAEEGEGESAIGDEGEVRAVGLDAGIQFGEGGVKVGAGFVGIVCNKAGAGPADEPRGAEAGFGEFLFDEGKDFGGLAGGEGGVDPSVAEDDPLVLLAGGVEDVGGFGGVAGLEEEAGVEEVEIGGVVGVEFLDLVAGQECGVIVVRPAGDLCDEEAGFELVLGFLGVGEVGFREFQGLWGVAEELDEGGEGLAVPGLESEGGAEISLGGFCVAERAVFDRALVVEFGGGSGGDLLSELFDGGVDVVMCEGRSRQDG